MKKKGNFFSFLKGIPFKNFFLKEKEEFQKRFLNTIKNNVGASGN